MELWWGWRQGMDDSTACVEDTSLDIMLVVIGYFPQGLGGVGPAAVRALPSRLRQGAC